MGGHRAAHWNHETEDWSVHSATDPKAVYRVTRKYPDGPSKEPTERQQQAARGWWWFTLDCTCPAIVSSGYAVCKHKACVRLWQLHYHRRDGRPWGDLPAHSNVAAQANDDYDPEGIERWKDRAERRGVSGLLDEPDADTLECSCQPGPVNCQQWGVCVCGVCWHERSGNLFDGSGNPW